MGCFRWTPPLCVSPNRALHRQQWMTVRGYLLMIRSIERRHSEVKELIRAQEKAEVSRAEDLLKRLEQEIAELKRRDAELEQLSQTEDHIHFLQVC